MLRATSSLIRKINNLKTTFDLDKDDLAEDLMEIVVDDIEEHMDQEEDPDGNAWEPLSEAYAEHKAKVAPGKPMAELYGIMKTRENLEGQRRITKDKATMVFGISEQAQQEAEWFSEGNPSNNQPPRPFYFIGSDCINQLDRFCRKRLDAAIKRNS